MRHEGRTKTTTQVVGPLAGLRRRRHRAPFWRSVILEWDFVGRIHKVKREGKAVKYSK